MSLEAVVAFLRRWAWLLILGGLLAGATSYAISARLPKVYQASAELQLLAGDATDRTVDSSQYLGLTGLARGYTEIVKTRPVLEGAIQDGGLSMSYEDLLRLVSVAQVPNTQMLQISARSSDPQQAANLAMLVSNSFMRQVQTLQAQRFADTDKSLRDELDRATTDLSQRQAALDQLRAQPATPQRDSDIARVQFEVTQLQQNYQNAAKSYSDFRLTRARSLDVLTVIQPASAALDPIEPRVLVNVALAAFVGILIALGAAWLVELLDDRLSTAERVTGRTGLQVLGAVNSLPGDSGTRHLPVLARASPGAAESNTAAEAFRLLSTNLRFLSIDKPLQTVLVTSSDAREGKTTIAANLAIAAAQAGSSVLLVDADLRQPLMHYIFRLSNRHGMTTLLLTDSPPRADVGQATEVPGLRVLTSGPIPPNPSQVLASLQMSTLLEQLRGMADLVIFDSPPLLAVSDSAHLAGQVDGVVLVVDAKRTRPQRVGQALRILRSVGAHVLGTVLNRLRAEDTGFYEYYGQPEINESGTNRKVGRRAAASVGWRTQERLRQAQRILESVAARVLGWTRATARWTHARLIQDVPILQNAAARLLVSARKRLQVEETTFDKYFGRLDNATRSDGEFRPDAPAAEGVAHSGQRHP